MHSELSCVPRRRICVGETCRGTRLVLDGGNRVAAELSAVITHAANHRQTSGHLHVGNAGSEHNMFLCFVFFLLSTLTLLGNMDLLLSAVVRLFAATGCKLSHQTCPNMWLTCVSCVSNRACMCSIIQLSVWWHPFTAGESRKVLSALTHWSSQTA